jgi:hypothetical protein
MGPMFLGVVRRTAVAWSDALLDLDQRWMKARERIMDPHGSYGTNELVKDSLATWVHGMQAWEKLWAAAYGSTQASVPVVMIRDPSLVGEATVGTPGPATLSTTDLAQLGAPRTIPRDDVSATVDGNGVLTVKIKPRGRGERAAGLYRGVVFVESAGTPRVVADIVVELSASTSSSST